MRMTLKDIAEEIGGVLEGKPEMIISGVSKIDEAKEDEITFLTNNKYIKFLSDSKASAIIVPKNFQETFIGSIIRVENPYYAFLRILEIYYPAAPLIEPGVHASAIIGKDTEIAENVSIGAHVVIGRHSRIGENTIVLPGVVIGDHVTIGHDCVLHANSSYRNGVVLRNRVIIHNGAVIGSDGFGFAPQDGKYHKIPQIGTVIIEDDVEIGANATIDRATMGETRIKTGAKIDNLVQVAHNCTIGEHTAIAAQTGLSGSTHLGKWCRVGGQVGFAGHMTVGDNVTIGAKSGVAKSVSDSQFVSGYPARPHREELHYQAALHKLPDLLKSFKTLKLRIEALENKKKD